jgi:hypothetical protein
MSLLEYLTINLTIMAIQREYYLLDKLEELWVSDKVRLSFYLDQKRDIEQSIEELCKDNPFNQLKEELNLI